MLLLKKSALEVIMHRLVELKRKKVIDNRTFWKMVKPVLSNNFVNNEKITLVDNEKSIVNDKEIAKVLNDFFSNIIKTLNIPKKDHTDSIVENVRDPTLKAILKYRKHPSILAIKRKLKSGPVFTFNHITKEDVIKEIKNLDAWKALQEDDITTKIIK